MKGRARGFTLIEVLVALAIVAFGMAAVLSSMTSAANSAFYMRDKTIATWIALNQITQVRLKGTMPQKGKSDGQVEDYAGRNWVWQQDVQPLQAPGLLRIEVSVRPLQEGESKSAALLKKPSWYATESGAIGDSVDYSINDLTDWIVAPHDPNDPNEQDKVDGRDKETGTPEDNPETPGDNNNNNNHGPNKKSTDGSN